jgi:toxin ParE1/3/4
MRLRYTNRAASDLRKIKAWSRKAFGDRRTKIYLESMEQCCTRLAESIEPARPVGDTDGFRRSYSVGSHVVYFRIAGDELTIVRVLHGSQDVRCHLPGA